ncbi:MAG: helix-turn-helix domain-containing protein [Solirubrobacteraceae bacterium]
MKQRSPIGTSARDAAAGRAARSAAYRAENARVGEYHGIAKLVVQRRTVLGISQRELARRVGTSEPAISRIESGRHATNVRTLRRVFKALGGRLVVGYELAGTSLTRELVAV